jgi:hypothetical protein
MGERDRQEMAPFAQMLHDTTARLTLAQGADHATVSGRIRGLPDVAPMVRQLIEQHTGRRVRHLDGVGAADEARVAPRRVVR